MAKLLAPIAALCLALVASTGAELLQNPDFEEGTSGWNFFGFNAWKELQNVHSGKLAVKFTGRSETYHGPSQLVKVTPGGRYSFQAWIQLIDSVNEQDYESVSIKIKFTWKDGSEEYFEVVTRPWIKRNEGWIELAADFSVPNKEYTEANLYLEGISKWVDFYFDDTSLKELPDNPNWKKEADQRIDELRKRNLKINFDVASNLKKKKLTVMLDLVKHEFSFGSMVYSDSMVDEDYEQYRNIVSFLFNTATIGDFKWKYNRGTRENPDYSKAVEATDVLVKKGLKVRGHNMFWAVDENSPDYVLEMEGNELKQEVETRIKYMTKITKGKLHQWDVNNELLHGHFFETATGDLDYSHHMYGAVHSEDPVPLLLTNEYDVVAKGITTKAYQDQLKELKNANIGFYGAGVQSHITPLEEPDPILLKARLDTIAQAGVPIWITELDLSATNQTARAEWFENVMRVYFSHPSVEGIVLWGWWDHELGYSDKAIVHGYGFELDPTGKKYVQLVKQEWSTTVRQSLSKASSIDTRAFKGDYELTVYLGGKPIQQEKITLGDQDTTLDIKIQGDGSKIDIPPRINPFAPVPIEKSVTTNNQWQMGEASSSSSDSTLSCVTRMSPPSEIGDDKHADQICESDEVLTGCSSYNLGDSWERDGDQIMVKNGVPTCRAINGYGTPAPVIAVARCCKKSGLTCNYQTAGPSGVGIDDQVVVPCKSSESMLGCSIYTWSSNSDGSIFTDTSCIGQNDGPTIGVWAYAACCSGTGGTCTSVKSNKPSGQKSGDEVTVACPAGSVMTGCNVFSMYSRAAGSEIITEGGVDKCKAVNGYQKYGSETGVYAMAMCCTTGTSGSPVVG